MPEFDSTIRYGQVLGFPAYCVGTDGSLWSRWGRGGARSQSLYNDWHRLQGRRHDAGYLVVLLLPGRVRRYVHHLVLEAFVGPCPPGMECRHFPDRDPTNNQMANLSWGTRKQNLADREQHGTVNCGERNGRAKLGEDDVRQMLGMADQGFSNKDIAAMTGWPRQTVYSVTSRRHWKHVTATSRPAPS